jgi:site-specific DNA-methyltransferase (adenine-specific)
MTEIEESAEVAATEDGPGVGSGDGNGRHPGRVQREYVLTYAGKQPESEILLRIPALPFQLVRSFGSLDEGAWHNLLIAGDNLPVLRRLIDMKNEGRLNNADGTPGVRLVYIDPPFASEDDYETKTGKIAYADKIKGAEFIEGLRRRLVLIRELLAADASLFVHLDWRKSHYIKAVMDEVFGEHAFVNEIVWCYTGPSRVAPQFPRKHDVILFYRVGAAPVFHSDAIRVPYKAGSFTMGGKGALAAKNREGDYRTGAEEQLARGKVPEDWWSDIPSLTVTTERVGFPTQKPERLAARIIKAASDPGDLVLDCFAGSGTALVAAEKLDRRWIGVDMGLAAIYFSQKRLLNTATSRALAGPAADAGKRVLYDQPPRAFGLYSSGHYDFARLKGLPFLEYRTFVLRLFGAIERPETINGLRIDGRHRGDAVMVFDFTVDPEAEITTEYFAEVARYLGRRVGERVLFIAPASRLAFLQDEVVAGGIDFEIRRVPYSVVNAMRRFGTQPTSEADINRMIETEGFDFAIPPKVETNIEPEHRRLTITGFRSRAIARGLTETERGLPALAMVLVDYAHDGRVFDLDEVFFAEDLVGRGYQIDLAGARPGVSIAVSFCDVFGNERIDVLTDQPWGEVETESADTGAEEAWAET